MTNIMVRGRLGMAIVIMTCITSLAAMAVLFAMASTADPAESHETLNRVKCRAFALGKEGAIRGMYEKGHLRRER